MTSPKVQAPQLPNSQIKLGEACSLSMPELLALKAAHRHTAELIEKVQALRDTLIARKKFIKFEELKSHLVAFKDVLDRAKWRAQQDHIEDLPDTIWVHGRDITMSDTQIERALEFYETYVDLELAVPELVTAREDLLAKCRPVCVFLDTQHDSRDTGAAVRLMYKMRCASWSSMIFTGFRAAKLAEKATGIIDECNSHLEAMKEYALWCDLLLAIKHQGITSKYDLGSWYIT